MTLPAETFHHAIRVRRLRVGDQLILFAGDGREAAGSLVAISRDAAEAVISAGEVPAATGENRKVGRRGLLG